MYYRGLISDKAGTSYIARLYVVGLLKCCGRCVSVCDYGG